MTRRGLLLDERLVCAHPSLVRALGLTKAVVLQQINWNIATAGKGHEHDGHTWYPVTAAALADQIGLSAVTMKRVLTALEEDGLLVSCQPEGRSTRRKWYRIDPSPEGINLICSEGINLIPSEQINLIPSSTLQQGKHASGAEAPHANDESLIPELVAGYVDDVRAVLNGQNPPAAFCKIAGREARRALAEGHDPREIARCLGVVARERKNPGSLPYVLMDSAANVPRRNHAR